MVCLLARRYATQAYGIILMMVVPCMMVSQCYGDGDVWLIYTSNVMFLDVGNPWQDVPICNGDVMSSMFHTTLGLGNPWCRCSLWRDVNVAGLCPYA